MADAESDVCRAVALGDEAAEKATLALQAGLTVDRTITSAKPTVKSTQVWSSATTAMSTTPMALVTGRGFLQVGGLGIKHKSSKRIRSYAEALRF